MLSRRLLQRGCKSVVFAVVLFVIVWLSQAILSGKSLRLVNVSEPSGAPVTSAVRSHMPSKKVFKKTFLAWTTKSGKRKWIPNNLRFLSCSTDTCKVTEDRTQLDTSDVIIFHSKDVDLQDLPKTRRKEQIWVYLNHEPPTQTSYQVVEQLSRRINITVTYRTDSDIYAPIYELKPLTNSFTGSRNSSDRKMVTWLVSHCKTSSNREEFVNKLNEFIPVDVWGSCGRRFTKCPKLGREECYKKLADDYKFYLAFENSLCKDYVSEKLYLAMFAGMVPVVFGAADYHHLLPPNSFIDALAFDSPKALADYLLKVGNDHQMFNLFLQWRTQFTVVQRRYRWLCELCEKMSRDEAVRTSSRNLTRWWFRDAQCRKWSEGSH